MVDEGFESVQSFDEWVTWFKNHILLSGPDDDCAGSFLRYLASLGFFEKTEQGDWRISGGAVTERDGGSDVRNSLGELSQTETGFAIGYFIELREGLSPFSLPARAEGNPETTIREPGIEKSSNVSNLQIVKKLGRQLRPFLDMEKEIMTRLESVGLQKEDARRIFNFIMSRTREKSEARPWEQHSRKRHK